MFKSSNNFHYKKNVHYRLKLTAMLCAIVLFKTSAILAQSWQTVGGSAITSSTATYTNLVKDASGNYYVSYYAGGVALGSVQKFNGTSWSFLGGQGITPSYATYNSLGVNNAGEVYYSFQDGANGSKLSVKKFSPTANTWSDVGVGISSGVINYHNLRIIPSSGLPVVTYNSSGIVAKRYDGTSWVALGASPITSGTGTQQATVISSADTVYVAVQVGTAYSVYKNAATADANTPWQLVGNAAFTSGGSSNQFTVSLAIDASNNLYLAYRALSTPDASKIAVYKFNGTAWAPLGNQLFSNSNVEHISIAVTPSGNPTVAFRENSPTDKGLAYTLVGSTWNSLGVFSTNLANYNSIIMDGNSPVVAYCDGTGVNGGLVTIKKYETPAVVCNNTLPGTTIGDVGCVTFNYRGQPVTYTTVRATDGKVWLQQNLGSAQTATAKDDTTAYGDLFQWGRWDDGHQLRNSPTAAVPVVNNPSGISANDTAFFIGSSPANWWNAGVTTDTWSAATTAAASATTGVDPCKAIGTDWRLPTEAEWTNLIAGEAITTPDLAYSSNLKLTVGGTRSGLSGSFSFVGQRGYYWSSTTSSTGGKYLYYSASITNPSAGQTRASSASVRCLNNSAGVSYIDSVRINTLNNVAATITANAGTLQLEAKVFPLIFNQNVTWSIVPGTGNASISTTGLVTGITNGTVWAKAVSVADVTKMDSILITISNQVVNVSSITVHTQNNVAAVITTNGGTLPVEATILPANATNQNVTWSIVSGTGNASISTTGLVTAITNGTVWAKAVSVADVTKMDSILITISNQVVNVSGITVHTQNNVAAVITTNAGTLPVEATILPANATNQDVTWSVVPGTGNAFISTTGLVTAITNGTVWAKAVSVADVTLMDSILITISNQTIAVTGLYVTILNNAPAVITTLHGTLQAVATIAPANASNQNVVWSLVSGTGSGTISNAGLVTAQSDGTVWAKAVSADNNALTDSLLITISGQQGTGVNDIEKSIGLNIYPNPVHHSLTIKVADLHKNLKVVLYDALGKVVLTKELNAATTTIDLAAFPNGNYMLSILGDEIYISRKVTKL